MSTTSPPLELKIHSKIHPRILLAILRHGPTLWTEEGRIQGRKDIPLSPQGRDRVATWHLPPEFKTFTVLTSPLGRARQTAQILGFSDALSDPRLTEMDWGEWEGRRLADLRAELRGDFTAAENQGLDFTPPGGESPRHVQERLQPLLTEIAHRGQATLFICHKGILRALYALATSWPMIGKLPHRLDDGCLHLFHLTPDDDTGRSIVGLEKTNIPLTTSAAPSEPPSGMPSGVPSGTGTKTSSS
ncbi:MAG: histidine phosphatase family protein [Alphaproteobacteria bacterium]